MSTTNSPARLPDAVEDALELVDHHEALIVEVTERGDVHCSSPSPETVPARVLRGPYDETVAALAVIVPTSSSRLGSRKPGPRISHFGVHVERGGGSLSFRVSNGRARLHQICQPNVLDDVARRRLALPTPAPLIGTGWYWSLAWIVDIVHHAGHLRPGDLLDPPTCAVMHPAAREWSAGADLDAYVGLDLTTTVVHEHRRLVHSRGWEQLRQSAIRSELPLGDCVPWFASRLDAGSFSRWLSSTLPAIDDLVPSLIRSLDHETQRLVGAVLADVLVDRRWSNIGEVLDADTSGDGLGGDAA